MKNALLSLLLFFCFANTYGQIGINSDGSPPHSSAILDVKSTTKAFYPPRMTTAQKNAIVSPQVGAVVYDTDLGGLSHYNGSVWGAVAGSGLSLPYNANTSQASQVFKISNSSTGNNSTIIGGTNSLTDGYGVWGIAYNPNPTGRSAGVTGSNLSTNSLGVGVYGIHEGAGIGVVGTTNSGTGVQATSNSGTGINANCNTGTAGYFSSSTGFAIKTSGKIRFGSGAGTPEANKVLKSINSDGDAEWSSLLPCSITTGSTLRVLEVINTSTGNLSEALYGESKSVGVHGVADNNGLNVFSAAIFGENFSTNGNGSGVSGYHDAGIGVSGRSVSKTGVYGSSSTGTGGIFTSISGSSLTTINGNVGIGTLTPIAKMDIKGSTYLSHFYYSTNEDTYIRGGKAGSKVLINDISGQGSVGIGITNPNQYLDVNGRMRIYNSTFGTAGLWLNNSTNSLNGADGAFWGMKLDTETGFYIGNAWRFWVTNTGNATLTGTLTQSSDRRLKKEINPLTNSLSSISNINGYHYKWIEASRSHDLQTGLIAQEVQKIFPELVQTDEKGFLSVNYIGLIPHLIEAVKELKNENNDLKSENKDFRNRLEKIEALLSASTQNTGK